MGFGLNAFYFVIINPELPLQLGFSSYAVKLGG